MINLIELYWTLYWTMALSSFVYEYLSSSFDEESRKGVVDYY